MCVGTSDGQRGRAHAPTLWLRFPMVERGVRAAVAPAIGVANGCCWAMCVWRRRAGELVNAPTARRVAQTVARRFPAKMPKFEFWILRAFSGRVACAHSSGTQSVAARSQSVEMAVSWSSIPSDLLRIIFASLAPRDLLAAAQVCRHWSPIAGSDALWCVRLSHARQQPAYVLLRAWTSAGGGRGPLSLRDVYLLAPHQKGIQLHWLARCPWHPRRHTRRTPINILRVLRCMVTSWNWWAFLALSGLSYDEEILDWVRSPAESRAYRGARHRDSDRLVTCTLRVAVTSLIVAAVGGTYLAAGSRGLFTPLRLLLVGMPLSILSASLLGLQLSHASPKATAVFSIIVNASFVLAALASAAPFLTSHILLRLSVLPAFGVVALLARFLKTQGAPPLGLHLFAAGCVCGAVVALWRVTLPTLVFVTAFVISWQTAWHIEAAGYTLL